jgi:catechol 2,3-dioxygenase-like lactoylglutathione lyase family enzyme
MHSDQIVPIVTTTKMRESREFYQGLLGLQLSFDHDHYLGVRAGDKGSPELGFMRPDADSPDPFAGKGITFAIRVKDADRECERLRQLGVPILLEPTDMAWGSRAFLIQDPNGVMVFVSHPIPVAVEYQACLR